MNRDVGDVLMIGGYIGLIPSVLLGSLIIFHIFSLSILIGLTIILIDFYGTYKHTNTEVKK